MADDYFRGARHSEIPEELRGTIGTFDQQSTAFNHYPLQPPGPACDENTGESPARRENAGAGPGRRENTGAGSAWDLNTGVGPAWDLNTGEPVWYGNAGGGPYLASGTGGNDATNYTAGDDLENILGGAPPDTAFVTGTESMHNVDPWIVAVHQAGASTTALHRASGDTPATQTGPSMSNGANQQADVAKHRPIKGHTSGKNRVTLARAEARQSKRFQCTAPNCLKPNSATGEGRVFSSKSDLHRHMQEVHGLDKNGGPFERYFCPHEDCKRHVGRGFPRLENLRHHINKLHSRQRHTDGNPDVLVPADAQNESRASADEPGLSAPAPMVSIQPCESSADAKLRSSEVHHAESPRSVESFDLHEQDALQVQRYCQGLAELQEEQRAFDAQAQRLKEKWRQLERDRAEYLEEQLRKARQKQRQQPKRQRQLRA